MEYDYAIPIAKMVVLEIGTGRDKEGAAFGELVGWGMGPRDLALAVIRYGVLSPAIDWARQMHRLVLYTRSRAASRGNTL